MELGSEWLAHKIFKHLTTTLCSMTAVNADVLSCPRISTHDTNKAHNRPILMVVFIGHKYKRCCFTYTVQQQRSIQFYLRIITRTQFTIVKELQLLRLQCFLWPHVLCWAPDWWIWWKLKNVVHRVIVWQQNRFLLSNKHHQTVVHRGVYTILTTEQMHHGKSKGGRFLQPFFTNLGEKIR